MNKSRIILLIFAICIIILSIFMVTQWYETYLAEYKHIQEDVQSVASAVADTLQNENLTLNNQAATYGDSDSKRKIAFAIGMSGNNGKMRLFFDEKSKQFYETLRKTTTNIGKNYIDSSKAQFIPAAVKTIRNFDSSFRLVVASKRLFIKYSIDTITLNSMLDTNKQVTPYSTKTFVINFYDPIIYQVHYSIPRRTVLHRIFAYTFMSTLLFLMVFAAFVLYYRSYRFQAQMANFKESMFSNITHELKTPVASLQLIIESLEKEGSNPVTISREYIDFAAKELIRVKLLINRILSFGKLDKQQFALNKEAITLHEVIADAIQIMQLTFQSYNGTIRYEEDGVINIKGDKALLTNMMSSLIDNALKYCKEIPVVEIEIHKEGRGVCIFVKDNGIGIDATYHKKIFNPFFRVPSGNMHNVKGHGLGLSFVAQVATLHKGRVYVESVLGRGSIFKIILPL